jgi:hypothetical protein
VGDEGLGWERVGCEPVDFGELASEARPTRRRAVEKAACRCKGGIRSQGEGRGKGGRMSRSADSVLLCFGFASPRLLSQYRDFTRCSASLGERVCPRQPEKIRLSCQGKCAKKIRDDRSHWSHGDQQHSASSAFPHKFAFRNLFDCLFQTKRDPERAFLFLHVAARRDREPAREANQPTAV